jgi:nucleoid-associated protein YgaU
MNRRWTATIGLTVAAVGAMAAGFALRSATTPAPLVTASAPESLRQESGGMVARSGPAMPAPSAAPDVAAAPAPASSPAPVQQGLIRAAPRFDVVRVGRDGAAVVAGRGEPGATITLMVDGKPVGTVSADANGQFVILPPPFAEGERSLSLASKAKDGVDAVSSQSVTVLGAEGAGRVVALAEPGAPTKILSDSAPVPNGETRIRTVEAEQGGAFYASGAAPAGATVRLYLNGGMVAETRASEKGVWSVRIEKGMTPGAYDVRADHVDAAGKVAARAQVAFDYPASTVAPAPGAKPAAAEKGAPAAAQDQAAEAKAAGTTVAVRTKQVMRGDSLWRLSARLYGSGRRYTEIYAANAQQIRNPDLIYPGQTLVAPEKP